MEYKDIVAGRSFTYKLSKDRKGLLCYYKPKHFFHIYSNELSDREKILLRKLRKRQPKPKEAL